MNPGSKVVWTVVTVLILVAGIALNAWVYFSKYPEKLAELEQAEKLRKEADLKLNGPLTEVDSITRIKADLVKFQEELAELMPKVPNLDRTEYDKFADELDSMRKRSGSFVWKAKWMIPRPPRASRGLKAKTWPQQQMHKVMYDMDLTGTFFELLRFVRMVEKQKRYVGIESFTITAGSGDDEETILQRKMGLKLYSFTYNQKDKPLEIEIREKRYSKTTEIPE